jgi:acyl-CoA reductase-like NAD-dependent aldehyde dehydrogenase
VSTTLLETIRHRIDAAVRAAHAAFETWQDVRRARIMFAFRPRQAVTSRWPQDAGHHRGHMHFPTAV